MDGLLSSYLSQSNNPIADGLFSVTVVSNFSHLDSNLEKIFGIGDKTYSNEWGSGDDDATKPGSWIELDIKRKDYVVRGISLKYIPGLGSPCFSLTGRNSYSEPEKQFYISTVADYDKLSTGNFVRIPIYNEVPFRYIKMTTLKARDIDGKYYLSLLRYDIDDYIINKAEFSFFKTTVVSMMLAV